MEISFSELEKSFNGMMQDLNEYFHTSASRNVVFGALLLITVMNKKTLACTTNLFLCTFVKCPWVP